MSGIFYVYYCGVVADSWDSCVGDFCVYYSGVVADPWIPVSGISVCSTLV